MLELEPCPPHLHHVELPQYGGSLVFRMERNLAACVECGWEGIPTRRSSFVSTACPACQHEPDAELTTCRVPRNQPCPCGSGVKAKKCKCEEYTT